MKPAYNVKFYDFGSCFLMTWENYAYGKHQHKVANEAEGRAWLAHEGWVIKG